MNSVDLKDVRAFCAVVDTRSITAAAQVLGETKGSVSRRIARLEKALGAALLRRSPRLVEPTDEGLIYRKAAGDALDRLDEAATALEENRAGATGHLRVTAPTDFAIGFLPPLLTRFAALHPSLSVDIVSSDDRLDFDAQRLDCALRVGALRDSNLKVHRLFDIEVGLYASQAYRDSRGLPDEPARLPDHDIVSFAFLQRPVVLRFERSSVTVEPRLAGDSAVAHRLVLEGAGIGVLPKVFADSDVEANRLVEVLSSHRMVQRRSLPFSLLYRAARVAPAKVRAFRDFMLEATASRRRTR